MITQIHFHQDKEHRIMTIAGDYDHATVKEVLEDNDVIPDNNRVLLVYIPQ